MHLKITASVAILTFLAVYVDVSNGQIHSTVMNKPLSLSDYSMLQRTKTCSLPVDTGNGAYVVKRWYYDFNIRRCYKFNFNGLDGNANRFVSETDCMKYCDVDFNKTSMLKRDDLVVAAAPDEMYQTNVPLEFACKLPKAVGDCNEMKTKYYFSTTLQKCLPFSYSGCNGNQNNWDSLLECEQVCKTIDGNVCGADESLKTPLVTGHNCDDTKCPDKTKCVQGGLPQCCTVESLQLADLMYSPYCPDYTPAAGSMNPFYQPIVSESCADLTCPEDYMCKQVKPKLAKCCQSKDLNKKLLQLEYDSILSNRNEDWTG